MISLEEIYDKDVNFLFGAGASVGLLPTLRLGMKHEASGESWTLEELATEVKDNEALRVPLFMHYYDECIRPAELLDVTAAASTPEGKAVIDNYRTFLETVLGMLQRRNAFERRCNIFTTNYDGCFPLVADEILKRGHVDFVLNDGARGFSSRTLQARNFNSYLCQTGIFGRHQVSIPQINLIHLHGSVYWSKTKSGGIKVDYDTSQNATLLDEAGKARLEAFAETLHDPNATFEDLTDPGFSAEQLTLFWQRYEQKPIVNPTKWKFHETVYEEHYYQMLRLLSYELEKPNAVLITFGFSFADEHILNLVLRSLSNPGLQVFVCCYGESTHAHLTEVFKTYRNVKCLVLDDDAPMDFLAFNEKVLTWPIAKKPNEEDSAPLPPAGANAAAEVLP